MSLIATLVANALFLATLGISLMNAWFWGEMAGIPKGGDKSGLGGLMAVMMFLALRWVAVALLLGIAAWRGGLEFLPGSSTWMKLGVALAIHAAIGALSYWGFSWVSTGLMHDNMGPQQWSWFFGIVIPLPMLLLAWWGINPGYAVRSPKMAFALALFVVIVHVWPFRSNVKGMRERRAAAEARKDAPVSAADESNR
jgi:hypothetical protein